MSSVVGAIGDLQSVVALKRMKRPEPDVANVENNMDIDDELAHELEEAINANATASANASPRSIESGNTDAYAKNMHFGNSVDAPLLTALTGSSKGLREASTDALGKNLSGISLVERDVEEVRKDKEGEGKFVLVFLTLIRRALYSRVNV